MTSVYWNVLRSLPVLTLSLFPGRALAEGQAAKPPSGSSAQQSDPWPHVFPILGDRAAASGMKMPLPFGLGVNYMYADQAIDISRVAVSVGDSGLVDLTDVIAFEEVRSQVHVLNARADLWLFPFLNVYSMANYIVESQTAVSISAPFDFTAGAVQPGAGGGFGVTLAGAAWGFFGTVDLNWTWNKMEKLANPVGTYLVAPRIGRNFGKVGPIELAVWVGAMRQDIESNTVGDISLSETVGGGDGAADFEEKLMDWYNGLPPGRQQLVEGIVSRIDADGDAVIHYELDKAIATPWNMLVGTEVGLDRHWRIRAEIGFIERFQVLLGLNYRFGDGAGKKTTP